MTRFLRTEDGKLINADHIVRIEGDSAQRCKATLDDNKIVWLADGIDQVEERLHPVVAADSGYVVLDYCADTGGGETRVFRRPVVAWRVAGDRALPVIPDGNDLTGPCFDGSILLPDGQVVQQGEQSFDSELIWRQWMAEQSRSKNEEEVAKKSRPILSSVQP